MKSITNARNKINKETIFSHSILLHRLYDLKKLPYCELRHVGRVLILLLLFTTITKKQERETYYYHPP
jgi:hypothetical protein